MSIEPGAIVMRNGRYGYQARFCRRACPTNENLPPQYRTGRNQDALVNRRLPGPLLPSGMPDKRKFIAVKKEG